MTTYYGPSNIVHGSAGYGVAAIGLAAPVGLTASQSLAPLHRPSDGRPREHSSNHIHRGSPPNSTTAVASRSIPTTSSSTTSHAPALRPTSAPVPQPPQQQPYGAPHQSFMSGGPPMQGGYGAPAGAPPPPPGQGYNYAAGYNGRRPQAPMNSDPQILSWFNAVDRDGSGNISARELQSALMNGDNTHFDIDTIRMLMSLFDVDRSGTINLQEFGGVWSYIRQWQDIFRRFDRDYSGTMDALELQNALTQLGYPLPHYTINLMQQKYQNTRNDEHIPTNGGLTFGHFIRVCVAVKTLTDSFRRLDPQGQGSVYMHYNQFLDLVFSGP